MKNHFEDHFNRLCRLVMLGSLIVLCSCHEEDGASSITFAETTQNLQEGHSIEIKMQLNGAATRAHLLKIRVQTNAIYGEHFETKPATQSDGSILVPVQNGASSAVINITSIDNDMFDGGKFVIFRLTESPTGLKAGDISTNTVVIGDDEGPSVVNFEIVTWVVGETETDGLKIEIPFSAATKGEGSLTVELAPTRARYGGNFFTVPEAVSNSIRLAVPNNSTSASITLFIVDDDLFTGDYQIDFSISEVSGVIQKGASAKLSLTVHDNERPSFASVTSGAQTIKEGDATGTNVEIAFSAPVPGTGTVSIHFPQFDYGPAYGRDFVTTPPAYGNTITLPVALHAVAASFKVMTIENSTCGYQNIEFNIAGTSGPIIGDDGTTGAVVIIEDDDSSTVTFSKADASVFENESGIEVHLNFPTPASQDATLFVTAPGYLGDQGVYGTLYYTTPQAAWDFYDLYVPLAIKKGDTGADFTIIPIDNDSYNAARVLVFRPGFSSNRCLNLNGEFALSILDDD